MRDSRNATSIVSQIRDKQPQHAVLMYSLFDILDDDRISLDAGITTDEVFNSQTDFTPGNVCASSLSVELLNYDGKLTGYDYARRFALAYGVERGATVLSASDYSKYVSTGPWVCVNSIYFAVRVSNGYVYARGTADTRKNAYTYPDGKAAGLYAVNDTVYVYDADGAILAGYTVADSGSATVNARVAYCDVDDVVLTDYAKARLISMADRRITRHYVFSLTHFAEYFRLNDTDTATAETHPVDYVPQGAYTGKRPSAVLGRVISFDASGCLADLDGDAKAYCDDVWQTTKTRAAMLTDILSPFGLSHTGTSGGYAYQYNPFSGLSGYTYRDLVALIAESMGCSVRNSGVYMSAITSTGALTISPQLEFLPFTSTKSGVTISTKAKLMLSDCFDISVAEYETEPIQCVSVRVTEDDIGVTVPDSPAGNLGFAIVDNPLLYGDSVEEIKTKAGMIWGNVSKAAAPYSPSAVTCAGLLLLEPGDITLVEATAGVYKSIRIYAMRTTWKGYAESTIECTGDKHRQELPQAIKEKLRNGGRWHEIIVDVDQLSSRMGDAEGDISELRQTASGLESRITNAEGDITTLEATASGLNAKVEQIGSPQMLVNTNSNISLVADPANTWLEGGWGKYAFNTYSFTFSVQTLTVKPSSLITYGWRFTASAECWGMISQLAVPLKRGKTYTLSCWAKPVSGSVAVMLTARHAESGTEKTNMGQYVTGTDWQRVTYSFTIENTYDYSTDWNINIGMYCTSAGGSLLICGAMLQEGATATDWVEINGQTYTAWSQSASGFQAIVSGETPAGAVNTTKASMDVNGIHLQTGGVFEVESGNFTLDASGRLSCKEASLEGTLQSGKFTVETSRLGYYNNANDYFDIKAVTDSRGVGYGVGVEGSGYVTIAPRKGYYGALITDYVDGAFVIYPNSLYDNGGVLTARTSSLGTSDPLNRFSRGYINDIYYYNLIQESSRERKKDITPLKIRGEIIDALKPVSFRYKNGDGRLHFGLIHEDTVDILPEICSGEKTSPASAKGVHYTELIMVLLSEVQELRRRLSQIDKDKEAHSDDHR